jgi:hypothetical protein
LRRGSPQLAGMSRADNCSDRGQGSQTSPTSWPPKPRWNRSG